MQTGGSYETFVELCATLRLTGWFKKNFKKPVSITLDDDCDLDDEIEEAEKEKAEKAAKEEEAKDQPTVADAEESKTEAAD